MGEYKSNEELITINQSLQEAFLNPTDQQEPAWKKI